MQHNKNSCDDSTTSRNHDQGSMLQNAADLLLKNNRIGSWHNGSFRYVDLEKNELHKNLVDLYVPVIGVFWHKFRDLIEMYKAGASREDSKRWIAAVYVSAWFHDLYVSNRKACDMCPVAANVFFDLEIHHKSTEYDSFLCALSAQIRPTSINSTYPLYIPRICQNQVYNALDGNFWNIDGWEMNNDAFRGIIHVMKQNRLMRFERLPENATGRPAWLFDWHDDGCAYSWFPMETNYTYDDVVIAYIVGGPCTSKLGPCDCDDLQQFPGNIVPRNIDKRIYQRIREQAFFGLKDVRVIETEQQTLQQVVDQLNGLGLPELLASPESRRGLTIEYIRIVDYVYYAKVIRKMIDDLDIRIDAHRMLTNW